MKGNLLAYLIFTIVVFLGGCGLPASRTQLTVHHAVIGDITYDSTKDKEWKVVKEQIDPDTGKVTGRWIVEIGAKTSEAVLQAFIKQQETQAQIWGAVIPIIKAGLKAAAPVPIP